MICYTAIFGNYEELKDPLVITPGWRYVCYTDQPLKSDVWCVVQSTILQNQESTRKARAYKIVPHSEVLEHDKSIWVDASFTINFDLNDFWNKHFKSPMTVFPHPWRKNVYDEINACIAREAAPSPDLENQRLTYKVAGLPNDSPVIMSGILLRENTEQVRQLCELWWKQIQLSTRDQVGFAFAEWKMPGVAHRAEVVDYRTSQEFIYKKHYNRR